LFEDRVIVNTEVAALFSQCSNAYIDFADST